MAIAGRCDGAMPCRTGRQHGSGQSRAARPARVHPRVAYPGGGI